MEQSKIPHISQDIIFEVFARLPIDSLCRLIVFNDRHREFPQDILFDIFSRLPIESLYNLFFNDRYKKFHSFIKDHLFHSFHPSRINKNDPDLLIFCRRNKFYVVHNKHLLTSFTVTDNSPDFERNDIKVVGSSNGLFCFSFVSNLDCFYICNPLTKETVKIPESPCLDLETITTGFCYDACKDKYKVVRLWWFLDAYGRRNTGVGIYNLGSHQWRRLRDIERYIECSADTTPLFLNDALHWEMDDFIGVLDIKTEIFRRMKWPRLKEGSTSRTRRLGSVQGCLSVIDDMDYCTVVWSLKTYGVGTWTEECVIEKEISSSLYPKAGRTFKTLKDGIILFQYLKKKCLFDLVKMESKRVVVKEVDFGEKEFDVFAHAGSFVSPKSIEGESSEVEIK
ncbi:hypothetical protein ACHQM5_000337 [Ranunculus cassubicifolius]